MCNLVKLETEVSTATQQESASEETFISSYSANQIIIHFCVSLALIQKIQR